MTVSNDGRAELYAAQSAEVWVQLITIEHAALVTPIRLCSNNEDIVSDGETFTAWDVPPILPVSTEGELPAVELAIGNVTRELTVALRAITTPITVTLEVVRASDPDTIEAQYVYESRTLRYAEDSVRIELGSESLMSERIPGDTYTRLTNPGLFEGVSA